MTYAEQKWFVIWTNYWFEFVMLCKPKIDNIINFCTGSQLLSLYKIIYLQIVNILLASYKKWPNFCDIVFRILYSNLDNSQYVNYTCRLVDVRYYHLSVFTVPESSLFGPITDVMRTILHIYLLALCIHDRQIETMNSFYYKNVLCMYLYLR